MRLEDRQFLLEFAEAINPTDEQLVRDVPEGAEEVAISATLAEQVARRLRAMAQDPPPRHGFELRIVVGSCDWEAVKRQVAEYAHRVERSASYVECNGATGAPDLAASIDCQRREVTADAYAAELRAWMERNR